METFIKREDWSKYQASRLVPSKPPPPTTACTRETAKPSSIKFLSDNEILNTLKSLKGKEGTVNKRRTGRKSGAKLVKRNDGQEGDGKEGKRRQPVAALKRKNKRKRIEASLLHAFFLS